jgi:hypothetical protein
MPRAYNSQQHFRHFRRAQESGLRGSEAAGNSVRISRQIRLEPPVDLFAIEKSFVIHLPTSRVGGTRRSSLRPRVVVRQCEARYAALWRGKEIADVKTPSGSKSRFTCCSRPTFGP